MDPHRKLLKTDLPSHQDRLVCTDLLHTSLSTHQLAPFLRSNRHSRLLHAHEATPLSLVLKVSRLHLLFLVLPLNTQLLRTIPTLLGEPVSVDHDCSEHHLQARVPARHIRASARLLGSTSVIVKWASQSHHRLDKTFTK
jgi:hypothetical protein